MIDLTRLKPANIDRHKRNKITISRNFYDVSHVISENMFVFPGDPRPKFESVLSMEKDKVNFNRITLGTHTGTMLIHRSTSLPMVLELNKNRCRSSYVKL